MNRHRRFEDEPTATKSIIIFFLIFLLTFSTSIALTSYPQHLAISSGTQIQAVKFLNDSFAIVRGNQVQVGKGDVIGLEGRDYIKITGNQVQIKSQNYPEAIRTVTAEWWQSVLFSQRVGSWNSNQAAQIVVDKIAINLIPLSDDIISVTATDVSKINEQSRYSVQFKSGTTYLNEYGVMIQLTKKQGTITASLIGVKKYSNIGLRIL